MTGVDFAAAGIEKATRAAADAGVSVDFVVDDLTDLRHTRGPFDFLLDYGVLDDLRLPQRELYKRSILPLTRPGSRFLLWGFEYPIRWWERLLPFMDRPFAEGEIAALFGDHFKIETIARHVDSDDMAAWQRRLPPDPGLIRSGRRSSPTVSVSARGRSS